MACPLLTSLHDAKGYACTFGFFFFSSLLLDKAIALSTTRPNWCPHTVNSERVHLMISCYRNGIQLVGSLQVIQCLHDDSITASSPLSIRPRQPRPKAHVTQQDGLWSLLLSEQPTFLLYYFYILFFRPWGYLTVFERRGGSVCCCVVRARQSPVYSNWTLATQSKFYRFNLPRIWKKKKNLSLSLSSENNNKKRSGKERYAHNQLYPRCAGLDTLARSMWLPFFL